MRSGAAWFVGDKSERTGDAAAQRLETHGMDEDVERREAPWGRCRRLLPAELASPPETDATAEATKHN
jgi:hypothetical protein